MQEDEPPFWLQSEQDGSGRAGQGKVGAGQARPNRAAPRPHNMPAYVDCSAQ